MPHYEYDRGRSSKNERRGKQPEDSQQEDLRIFLSHKIKDINKKVLLNDDSNEFNMLAKPLPHQSRYKVNHISEIQSVRIKGDAKAIEEQFNDRVAKTDANFQFKNALLNHDKKVSKQLTSTVNRFHEVHQQMLSQKTAYHTQDSMMVSSQGYPEPAPSNYEDPFYQADMDALRSQGAHRNASAPHQGGKKST